MKSEGQSLVSMAQKGDISAFEALIEGLERKVFNLALKSTGDRVKASDLAQEIFIMAFRTISGLENEACFPIWLLKLAADKCRSVEGRNSEARHWGTKTEKYRKCSGI